MTVLDYLLDGIEAELALERELGVRSIACDRELLQPSGAAPQSCCRTLAVPPAGASLPQDGTQRPNSCCRKLAVPPAPSTPLYDFVFLHDRALSADGVTMMAKIIGAMHKTAETAPIVFTGERPPAKVYVVLGGNALKKWFPGVAAGPGQWISTPDAPNVLVTYSPAYILRFGTVTPAVMKIKKDMWTSLKGVKFKI